MAQFQGRHVLFSVFFVLLCDQVAGFDTALLKQLIKEPLIMDVRVKSASIFNRAHLGVGGALSWVGKMMHDLMVKIGERHAKFLIKLSKLFIAPFEKHTTDGDHGSELKHIKVQELAQGGFLPESRGGQFKQQWKKNPRVLLELIIP